MNTDYIIGFALIALAIVLYIAIRIDAASERKARREDAKRDADWKKYQDRTFTMLKKI